MNDRAPGRGPDAGADPWPGAVTAGGQATRWLIALLLFATAALDLTRCGMVLAAARHPAPVAGVVAAGLAAATLGGWTARGCLSGRRWPAWAALLIGTASAPQAAATGFGAPYTIPDIATAALGILLAVVVLATAGRTRRTHRRDVGSVAVVCAARRQPGEVVEGDVPDDFDDELGGEFGGGIV